MSCVEASERSRLRQLDADLADSYTSEIVASVVELDRGLSEALKPPPGAYALFNHSSHLITRSRDVRRITQRLLDGRLRLTELLAAEMEFRPFDDSLPREAQELMSQQSDVVAHLRQDFETLYLFGHLQLDQFAHLALRVGGLPLKTDDGRGANAFTLLAKWLENGNRGALSDLWTELGPELIWLQWHVWVFRNEFVVHADRPWQRGANYGHVSNEFELHIPSPIGWADLAAQSELVASLWGGVQDELGDVRTPFDTPPGVLIGEMFHRIDEISNREKRNAIGRLFAEMGGMTPTFQIVAGRLLRFVSAGMRVLIPIAMSRASEVELGQPYRTQEDIFREYHDEPPTSTNSVSARTDEYDPD